MKMLDIELTNVLFHYPDQQNTNILNIPSWSLTRGVQTFIHGPSGCGKSTFLGMLSGMLLSTRGQVVILGQRLELLSDAKRDRFRANNIGYVFQQFNLIPYLNAIDNIKLANYFSKHHISAITEEVKSLLVKLNIPQSDWTKPARYLSVGQQQRISIARALINKPQLLIVDEPTSALDLINRDAFMSLLMPIVTDNNITLVFISHDKNLAEFFCRVESFMDFNLREEAM